MTVNDDLAISLPGSNGLYWSVINAGAPIIEAAKPGIDVFCRFQLQRLV